MASPTALVDQFIEGALSRLRRDGRMRVPDPKIPVQMRDPSIEPEDDWIGWKPVPSIVTDKQLDELENETQLKYPPLYRDFLKTVHFYELPGAIEFEEHVIDRWQARLRALYRAWQPERIIRAGLIPFGSESMMDAGPVCFDTRFRLPNGDCPVVFWDHGWTGSPKEIRSMFSSSAKMFECLGIELQYEFSILYHDPEYDEPEELPAKRAALNRFLDADPTGAGGPAREYWTSWGVNPDAAR